MIPSAATSPATFNTRVLRLRLKDKHATMLRDRAVWVNQIWNYCNDLQQQVWRREKRFLSGYDFAPFTKGAGKEGIPFSLGWIPFKASALSYRNGQFWMSGIDQPLSQYKLGAGAIAEDARGRWYINITVKVPKAALTEGRAALGIDLGLKDFAAFSDPVLDNVEVRQFYRDLEPALAVAQRANKKQRVKALHAKIANRRKDFHHQLSTALVRRYGAIFVGNVNASALAQTRMAKFVLDAGGRNSEPCSSTNAMTQVDGL